ncbi:hypothetical protein KR093_009071 [Drosophila rubida]|uniref:Single domain-containing protein n=1 Tax=Drosophila rubida TaxID=30044 RepID=A0AAD4K8I6_9MUSC|nr:hypothetical protein KR093_009071 [Drosophila rubida]
MKLLLNALLLLFAALLLPHTEAGLMQGKFANPAHPGKCFVSPNLILSPGEKAKYPQMECARIICQDNSYAQIMTCGAVGGPPNCKLKQSFPNADYPKCCEVEFICDN